MKKCKTVSNKRRTRFRVQGYYRARHDATLTAVGSCRMKPETCSQDVL